MKKILFYIVVLFSIKISAQNLVLNPSFEIYSMCPSGVGAITYATSWYSPNLSSPDYFNSCATDSNCDVPSNYVGFQSSYAGNAYAGIAVYVQATSNAREYIQTKLSDTLLANEIYCVSFYVNPANISNYGCDKVGCYFSSTSVTGCGSCLMSYVPQVESSFMIADTSTWVKVFGYFTAVGDEQYLTIGNFRLNANTNTTVINSSVSNQETYLHIDDISVMLCSDTLNTVPELKNYYKIELFPNPNNGNALFKYNIKQSDSGILAIYDLTGKLIEKYELNPNKNELQIESNLSNGIYFYQIMVNDEIAKSDKLVIIR